jgi:hypothetical protein
VAPFTADFLKGPTNYQRKQIPLMLAAAITIYKSQGGTLTQKRNYF